MGALENASSTSPLSRLDRERVRFQTAKAGPDAEELIDFILRSQPHPEQSFPRRSAFLGWPSTMARNTSTPAAAGVSIRSGPRGWRVALIVRDELSKTIQPMVGEGGGLPVVGGVDPEV